MASETPETDLQMDPAALYREEVFTDRKVGSIRRLTPVTPDGAPDQSRDVIYSGQTQLLTPAGALPLNFELEAKSLDDAANQFAEAAQQAAERTIEELKELRRESASSIYVPGQGQGGGMPGGGGGSGMPGGGGGFQMP